MAKKKAAPAPKRSTKFPPTRKPNSGTGARTTTKVGKGGKLVTSKTRSARQTTLAVTRRSRVQRATAARMQRMYERRGDSNRATRWGAIRQGFGSWPKNMSASGVWG